jgi:P pilus assembly chaperone PapD
MFLRRRLRSLSVVAFGMLGIVFASTGLAQEAAAPAPAPQSAAASPGVNLNITPKRLTFARGQRSATVYIYNRGDAAATFDISMIDRVMLPSGDIRPAEDAAVDPQVNSSILRLKSAQTMVVVSPRRATLQPGKGQTIRIRVTPPAGGEAAEYRSHLTVATVPPRDFGFTAENAAAGRPDQLSFRVNSVFGVSIPIIIRTGSAEAEGKIRNLRLTYLDLSPDGLVPPKRTAVVMFELARAGASSLYGNIEVRSRKEQLGLARGLGVYPEIDQRTVSIPLRRSPTEGELLEVTFTDDDASPGRIVTKTTFNAP